MSENTELRWSPDAEKSLKRIPFFVRPMAKKKIEAAARARGASEITVELMNEVKPSGGAKHSAN